MAPRINKAIKFHYHYYISQSPCPCNSSSCACVCAFLTFFSFFVLVFFQIIYSSVWAFIIIITKGDMRKDRREKIWSKNWAFDFNSKYMRCAHRVRAHTLMLTHVIINMTMIMMMKSMIAMVLSLYRRRAFFFFLCNRSTLPASVFAVRRTRRESIEVEETRGTYMLAPEN